MENIRLEDFTKYKFVSGIRFSSDGRHACFVLHEMDVEDNKYLSNLWLYDSENGKYFRLTAFNKEGNFTWMNDNENILFSGIRNEKDREKQEAGEEFTQFYKINIYGGEAQEAFRLPIKAGSIEQLNNNTYIVQAAVNLGRKELYLLDEKERSEELKKKKEEKDYEILDEIPFWSNGRGFTNKNRKRLYIFSSDSGKLEPLTDGYMDVESFSLNKNKTKLVFSASLFENKAPLENAVYVCDIASASIKRLTAEGKFNYGYVDFIDENKIICTGSSMEPYGINQNSIFYIIDPETKERICITPELDLSIGSSVGSDCRYGSSESMVMDDGYLYFIYTKNDSSNISRLDRNGKIEGVTSKKGSIDGFTVRNGRVIFTGMRNMRLQELYSLEGNVERQITDFNEWIQRERKIADLEPLSIETSPDVLIDGWVMKPVDFAPDKKYPAIFDIHGGPKTVYGEVFFHEMQYWANEGYFVFFCNRRGSDGKGNEFADIRGKYGTIDYDDLMSFMDKVLEKYSAIDPERVGVTGGSYGGYMTNWIIGHTDRFKAAASQRSISNWISMFSTTDIGYFFADDQIGATPWNGSEKLWEHSPLKYADKVKTPTLFIHSEEDYRCWLVEGIQMFTALKYHGVDARLCMFRGENHELSRSGKPKHRIKRLREITEWFDRYLKN